MAGTLRGKQTAVDVAVADYERGRYNEDQFATAIALGVYRRHYAMLRREFPTEYGLRLKPRSERPSGAYWDAA